jgi:NOL1/NOP2/fmu family ribosome biogenesis protein
VTEQTETVEVQEQTETVVEAAAVEVTEEISAVVEETIVESTEQTETIIEKVVEVTEQTETIVATEVTEQTETVVETVSTEQTKTVVKTVLEVVSESNVKERGMEIKSSLPREVVPVAVHAEKEQADAPASGIFVYRFDSEVAQTIRISSENDEAVRLQDLEAVADVVIIDEAKKIEEDLPLIVEIKKEAPGFVEESSTSVPTTANVDQPVVETNTPPVDNLATTLPSSLLKDIAIASENAQVVELNEEEAKQSASVGPSESAEEITTGVVGVETKESTAVDIKKHSESQSQTKEVTGVAEESSTSVATTANVDLSVVETNTPALDNLVTTLPSSLLKDIAIASENAQVVELNEEEAKIFVEGQYASSGPNESAEEISTPVDLSHHSESQSPASGAEQIGSVQVPSMETDAVSETLITTVNTGTIVLLETTNRLVSVTTTVTEIVHARSESIEKDVSHEHMNDSRPLTEVPEDQTQRSVEVTEPHPDGTESSTIQDLASSAISGISSESFEKIDAPTQEEYPESKPAESITIPHTNSPLIQESSIDKDLPIVSEAVPLEVTTPATQTESTFTAQVAKKMSLKEIEIPKESDFDVPSLIGEAEARVSSSPKSSRKDPESATIPSNTGIEPEPKTSFTITTEKIELQAPAPAVVSEKQPVPPSRSTLDLKRKKSTKSTKSKKSGRCTIL